MISCKGSFPVTLPDDTLAYIQFSAYTIISISESGSIRYQNYLSTIHDLDCDVIDGFSEDTYMLKDGNDNLLFN